MIPILSKQALRTIGVPMLPYLNVSIRVTIAEKYVFDTVESIEINNSLESLTDTAKVVIPRLFFQRLEQETTRNIIDVINYEVQKMNIKAVNLIDVINLDDKIKIEAGYENDLKTEFEGYITGIKDNTPVILECKDEMYKLEIAEKINANFRNADIKDILKKIAPTYKIETFKVFKIGKFSIENARPYEVLMELKNKHIRTYFKDGVLCAGLPINLQGITVHQFNMNRNVRKGESLIYEKKKTEYYVKVISNEIGTSKPIFFEIGKKGENNKEIHLPAGMSKKDLEVFAKDFHKGQINKKCTGSFESWGIPRTRAGDTADITTPNFPNNSRNGKYIIESVKISLSASDGFKRTNTLGVMLYK